MLGGAVVPDRDVADLPVPAHGVLQPLHVALEERQQGPAVGAGDALDPLGEGAEQQVLLAGHRVDPDHRVLGLERGRDEDLPEQVGDLGVVRQLGAQGQARRVVVVVGVHGAQRLGQHLQRLRQVLVRGGGVGPHGRAAGRRQLQGAEDRGLGVGGDEGDVGVPVVGAHALGGVQLEDVAAVRAGDGGVADRVAQQAGEGLVLGVVQVLLAAEEQHLVLVQGGLDRGDGLGGQLAAEADVVDDRADPAGGRGEAECGGGGGGHGGSSTLVRRWMR